MRVSVAGPWARRLVFGLTALVILAGTPSVARADCLTEAIESCNEDFSSLSDRLAGIRGWCYLIRWGWCELLDPKDT